MSKRSEEYVNELTRCPDGFRINCAHKAILGVLSECHSPVKKTIYPSMDYIAEKSCIPISTAKVKMKELEDHLVLERLRPVNQGRGQLTEYVFLEIDAPDRLRSLMLERGLGDGWDGPESEPDSESTKGVSGEPLSHSAAQGKRGQEGVRKGLGRGQEGASRAIRNKEEPGTGNREPGNAPENLPPIGFKPIELAVGVLSQLGIPADQQLLHMVGQSIEILAREEQTAVNVAARNIIERGIADRSGGVTINRFWFADQKFKQPAKTGCTSMTSMPRRQRTPAEKLAEQDGV